MFVYITEANHCISTQENILLRQFDPPEIASIITPSCSEKQAGNQIFTILPLQITLYLFIGQKIPGHTDSDALGWEEASLHKTRQEGLLWDSATNKV